MGKKRHFGNEPQDGASKSVKVWNKIVKVAENYQESFDENDGKIFEKAFSADPK